MAGLAALVRRAEADDGVGAVVPTGAHPELERELGVDLFIRTTRELRLTDAGRALLDGARRTLTDAEQAAEDAKRAGAAAARSAFGVAIGVAL